LVFRSNLDFRLQNSIGNRQLAIANVFKVFSQNTSPAVP
jgi:hypothetical protein